MTAKRTGQRWPTGHVIINLRCCWCGLQNG